MVRVNLINPKKLSDQHLVAEYDEILMLLAYVRKYPLIKDIPEEFCLGKGHINFFKNKLKYLKKRHKLIKIEMRNRGFKASKTIRLSKFNKKLIHDWKPSKEDIEIIKKRLIDRINLKPKFYRYYGKNKSKKFFICLIKKK